MTQDKAIVRRAARAARRARTAGLEQTARDAIAHTLAGHLVDYVDSRMPSAGVATAFSSLPSEPPTEAIIQGLQDRGWQVLLPVVLPDFWLDWTDARGGPMSAHRQTTEQLAAADIPLLGRDAVARADLLIVPGLLIGRDGSRLGQGGGCYDRALSLRAPGSTAIALVWDGEVVDTVPRAPTDLPVDAVLTPADGIRTLPVADLPAP